MCEYSELSFGGALLCLVRCVCSLIVMSSCQLACGDTPVNPEGLMEDTVIHFRYYKFLYSC